MTKIEISQCVASCHNRLANIFASGGAQLLSADSVVLMGDTIKELRSLAQQLMADVEAEEAQEDSEAEAGDSREHS